MTTTTVLEFLVAALPQHEARLRAIAAADTDTDTALADPYNGSPVAVALRRAFVWAETADGDKFWQRVHDELANTGAIDQKALSLNPFLRHATVGTAVVVHTKAGRTTHGTVVAADETGLELAESDGDTLVASWDWIGAISFGPKSSEIVAAYERDRQDDREDARPGPALTPEQIAELEATLESGT